MKRLTSEHGFTLIELMLVVIIIGILAAMIMPRFTGRSEEARIVAAQSDIKASLAIAIDLYEMDNGTYPSTEQGLEALRVKPSTPPVPANWKGPYLKQKVPTDPWKNPYQYVSPGVHNTDDYDLYSYGPDGLEGGGDDITNWEE